MSSHVNSNSTVGSPVDPNLSASNKSKSIRDYAITAIALAGIALMVFSLASFVVPQLSYLPIQVKVLSGVFGLAFLFLSYRSNSSSSANEEFQMAKEEDYAQMKKESVVNEEFINLNEFETRRPRYSASTSGVSITSHQITNYETFPEPFRICTKQVLDDLGISDLDSYLKTIYKDRLLFINSVCLNLIIEGNVHRTDFLAEQVKILLLSDDQILALTIDEVNKFSKWGFALLHYRLWEIKREPFVELPQASWEDFCDRITLREFRSIQASKFFDYPSSISINTSLLGLASEIQIADLLNAKQTPVILNSLLPMNSTYAKYLTSLKLKKLPIPAIRANIKTFSKDHFAEFSTAQLKDPHFPWDLVGQSQDLVDRFLSLDGIRRRMDTQDTIQNLPMNSIRNLLPGLSGEYLRLFSNEQLQDPAFPWQELAKSKEKVRELFSLEPLHEEKTRSRIQALQTPTIQILLPELTGTHLRILSNEQLLGYFFPWQELAKSKEKVRELFSLEPEHKYATRLHLEALPVSIIKILLPELSSEHLCILSKKQLSDANFPWQELVKSEEKIRALFPLETRGLKYDTESLLQALPISIIKILFPLLTADHLELLSIWQKQDFPWEEFNTPKNSN